MYLAQVTRYGILYSVNHLAMAVSKPAKAHIKAAKPLIRYLTGPTDSFITYKQCGFRLPAFSDANWGNKTENGRSLSSYVLMLANALSASRWDCRG